MKVSIYNLRKDTLCFAAPYLIFAKEALQQNIEESDIVVKQFIPNIVTDKVTAYCITGDNKRQIISVDSSNIRNMKQYEYNLPPEGKFVTEYLLNCKESDIERYKIFFFESNRYNSSKYEKIKYPLGGYIEIKEE